LLVWSSGLDCHGDRAKAQGHRPDVGINQALRGCRRATLVILVVIVCAGILVPVAAGWPAGLKALTLAGAAAAGLSPALSWALRVLYLAWKAREERELRVCVCLVAMLMSSLPAHNVGRTTLKRPESTSPRIQASNACRCS
jgi:hypothetical protein